MDLCLLLESALPTAPGLLLSRALPSSDAPLLVVIEGAQRDRHRCKAPSLMKNIQALSESRFLQWPALRRVDSRPPRAHSHFLWPSAPLTLRGRSLRRLLATLRR